MNLQILEKGAIAPMVEALIADYRVVGPQAKGTKFVFDTIADANELRLDYNTTILPPKKVLQPQHERLATFNLQGEPTTESVVEAKPTVLFGVHTCDLKAINLLDEAFSDDYPDAHYLSRREKTLLVSIECLKPCDEHSFCKDMGTLTADGGYDLHLTEIESGYLVETGSEAGEELLAAYAQSSEGGVYQSTLEQIRSDKQDHFESKLHFDAAELPAMLGDAFEHPIWQDMGERCLACGSCTNVCPTCYCFNIEDEVNMTLTEGERVRSWDSCQLDEFASVAGGENFRESRAARQRHRLMRKGKYIYAKFDELGCVGCGRCIRTCTAKISIVESYNAIYDGK
ncbi:MAG: 4Fe-4S dicluster domain-containing protein [Chloroflexota bacterium]|nr:4Fe-4S dicluster domain-containing protein [Chloroflexota bacterium]